MIISSAFGIKFFIELLEDLIKLIFVRLPFIIKDLLDLFNKLSLLLILWLHCINDFLKLFFDWSFGLFSDIHFGIAFEMFFHTLCAEIFSMNFTVFSQFIVIMILSIASE